MNEQELADLFSEQVDRLLQGQEPSLAPEAGELADLLQVVGQPAWQSQFQAGATAQAVFQSQLAHWFGIANGGSTMTILGLSKVWLIAIMVTVVTVVVGLGFVAVSVTNLVIFSSGSYMPTSPVATPVTEITGTPEVSATVEISPTAVVSGTPELPAPNELPTLIFHNNIYVPSLCQGIYTVQPVLVNYGNGAVDDAAMAWQVVEGADLVNQVNLDSDSLQPSLIEGNAAVTSGQNGEPDPTNVAATGVISPELTGYVFFTPIPVQQQVKVKVKVKVKESWWDEPDGTMVKVKLMVKNKHKGHWFDDDDYHHGAFQTVTIVKQSSQWVTLTGFPQNYGEGQMLLDGHVVVVDGCTSLPVNWVQGSKIKVFGLLQPNGTFLAVSVILVNVNVIIDYNSGVPMPSGGDHDGGGDGGGGGGGGGGHGGGSKKGGS